MSEFPCGHLADVLRTETCKPCGGERSIDVYRCFWFGECTIHSHGGLRVGNMATAPLLPTCMGCDIRPRREDGT